MKKRIVIGLIASFAIMIFSCRDNAPKNPATENEMEGVQQSKQEAMERAEEWKGPDSSIQEKEDVRIKDSLKKDSIERSKKSSLN